jgi:predicted HTH domain antitoxin
MHTADMRSHAVETATTLYEAGTLTLEQAAGQAGLSVDQFAGRVEQPDVDLDDDHDSSETPLLAD